MWRSVCGQAFVAQRKNNFLKTHFSVMRIKQTNKNKERNQK